MSDTTSRQSDFHEELRQMRAALERRFLVNNSGRYVIHGEDKRPVRRVRERLVQRGWLRWTSRYGPLGNEGVMITDEGSTALALMEANSRES